MAILMSLAFIAAWLFFYQLLKARNKKIPAIKASIVTLLFAALIIRLSTDLYAYVERAMFAFNKEGEVQLASSALKIPVQQGLSYCQQFTDQHKKVIKAVSRRADGEYCGEFWHFDSNTELTLPYKRINAAQIEYWASPTLTIIGPSK